MASVIAHVIAFTSLLLLTTISIQFVENINNYNLQKAAKVLATETSHLVANDIANLIHIAMESNLKNLTIIKDLEIRENILGKGYILKLLIKNDFYVCKVEFIEWKWIKVFSEIPINVTSSNVILELNEGSFTFENYTIYYNGSILSGSKHPVIWVIKENNRIKAGLGVKI